MEKIFRFATALSAILCALFAAAVFVTIALKAFPFFSEHGLGALFRGGWDPTEGRFDLRPMIAGTLLATFLGLALSAPAGVALGAFSAFYAPRPVARLIRLVLGILSGMPSVVVGLFALTALVPLILQYRQPGLSLLAGALVLALMTLPTIAALSDAAFRQIEEGPLLGAYALGLSRRAVVFGVALPKARPALFSAILLAVGRALGEAMAVLMVMGNVSQVPKSLFDPARTLTMLIASEMDEALGAHRSALFAAAFLLLAGVGLLSFLAPQQRQDA